MYFDTHAHYDDRRFDEDRDAILGEMQSAGKPGSLAGLEYHDYHKGEADKQVNNNKSGFQTESILSYANTGAGH